MGHAVPAAQLAVCLQDCAGVLYPVQVGCVVAPATVRATMQSRTQ
jgi:hypothetical protein